MLVLTRRVGESVIIGDNITVTILEVRGDVIRVGIDAPREVNVHRSEVYAAIEEANREAAAPSPDNVSAFTQQVQAREVSTGETK